MRLEISFDVEVPEGTDRDALFERWLDFLSLSRAEMRKLGIVVRSPEMSELVVSDAPRSTWKTR